MNSKLKEFVLGKFLKMGQDLIQNPEGLKFKLSKAIEKLQKDSVKEALGNYWSDLMTFIRLIKSWLSRKYRKMSKSTLVYAVVAVIYFLTPTDFVPDFILGLGFIDDIAVVSWVLTQIKDDLDAFKDWELKQNEKKLQKDNQNVNANTEEK